MDHTLFSIPLNADEYLGDYLLRVAESEGLYNVKDLLSVVGVGTSNAQFVTHAKKIARFTRQPESLVATSLVCVNPVNPLLNEKYARLTSSAHCPHCVAESGYFKAAWKHSLVTACPEHQCRLVDHCQGCGQLVSPTRAIPNRCDCGFNLAEGNAEPATPHEVWFARRMIGDTTDVQGACDINGSKRYAADKLADLMFFLSAHGEVNPTSVPLKTKKFGTVDESFAFMSKGYALLINFPQVFENHVKTRLELGSTKKAGLKSRLGEWLPKFRDLTAEEFPELRLAFARTVATNFDGHDSKNPWINELCPPQFISLAECARQLGVGPERLRVFMVNSGYEGSFKENSFSVVKASIVNDIREHLAKAMSESQFMRMANLPKSTMKALIDVGLIARAKRETWDLNFDKPFDGDNITKLMDFLFASVEPTELRVAQQVKLSDINSRLTPSRAAFRNLLDAIGNGTLVAKNTIGPNRLGDLVFDSTEVSKILHGADNSCQFTAEQVSVEYGWKGESIRNWIQGGLLKGELGEHRGQVVYLIQLRDLKDFHSTYIPVSELAKRHETTPKHMTELLLRAGATIYGSYKDSPAGGNRGGLVKWRDILCSSVIPQQKALL